MGKKGKKSEENGKIMNDCVNEKLVIAIVNVFRVRRAKYHLAWSFQVKLI